MTQVGYFYLDIHALDRNGEINLHSWNGQVPDTSSFQLCLCGQRNEGICWVLSSLFNIVSARDCFMLEHYFMHCCEPFYELEPRSKCLQIGNNKLNN